LCAESQQAEDEFSKIEISLTKKIFEKSRRIFGALAIIDVDASDCVIFALKNKTHRVRFNGQIFFLSFFLFLN
jgi:hypothetical protein